MADYDDSLVELIEFIECLDRADEINADALEHIPPRVVRDRGNPMEEYNDSEFLRRYRFSKRAVQQLLAKLPLRENTDARGCPLPPLLQLLVVLRFYGAGTFQIVTGDLVNVSQPTVSRVVARLSMMIAATLYPTLCKLPTATEAPAVMQQFFAIAGFPGVTGCIDCTHVPIRSPGGDDAEVFRNRKGYFSINVQVSSETAQCSLHMKIVASI